MVQTYSICILGENTKILETASYLVKKGHKSSVWSKNEIILKKRDQTQSKEEREGEINNDYAIYDELFKAVKDVQVILISLGPSKQLEILDELIPFIKKNQIILFIPGYTFGAIMAYNKIKEKRDDLKVYIGETESIQFWNIDSSETFNMPYHLQENVLCCFYPEINNRYVDYIVHSLFPNFKIVDNIKSTSMRNYTSILNAIIAFFSMISLESDDVGENCKYTFIPEMAKLAEALDNERCKIMDAMGLKISSLPDRFKKMGKIDYCDYFTVFQDIQAISNIPRPTLQEILVQSINSGLIAFSSIGKRMDINLRTVDSLIHLAGILLGIDFETQGRTMTNANPPESFFKKKQEKKTQEKKLSLDSLIGTMCDQILKDLGNGWIFIQAPRKLMYLVKEILHETTGHPVDSENWKEYFSSRKTSKEIALTKKTDELRDALELGDEFNDFYGMIMSFEDEELKIKPMLFLDQKEADDFIKQLEEELHEFINKVLSEERKEEQKRVEIKDFQE